MEIPPSRGSPGEPDDFQLMERVKRGSAEAFTELFGRHQAALYRFFRRLGADRSQAEDEVQETFLKIYVHRARYRPLVSFRAFLYSVARNTWYDRLRKKRRSREIVRLDDLNPATTDDLNLSTPSSVEKTDSRIDVQESLNSLSERMRVVLILSVYQGLSYPEIADVLGIPVGTVKTRVFYALRRLKEYLETHV